MLSRRKTTMPYCIDPPTKESGMGHKQLARFNENLAVLGGTEPIEILK